MNATDILIQNGQYPTLKQESKQLFLRACKEGRSEIVEAYLQMGMPTDIHEDISFETPLIRAAEGNHSEIVRILVKYGADLEGRDHPGDTALHTAANWGNLDVLKTLHELGAKVDSLSEGGYTPLTGALKNGKMDCYKYLLKYANPNLFPEKYASFMHFCIWNRHESELEKYLKSKKSAANLDIKDEKGDTLLMYALKRQNNAVAKMFIEHGANPNICNAYGWTAYYYALITGNMEIANLLEDKTDLSIGKNEYLFTKAIKAGKKKEIEGILGKADINTLDFEGKNALMIACATPKVKTTFLDFLIEKGADLHHFDMNNQCLIDIALNEKQPKIAQYLLSLGAKPNQKDGICRALYMPISDGKKDIVEMLVEGGANIQDLGYAKSAFIYSKKTQAVLEIITYLAQKGANFNAKDAYDNLLGELAYNMSYDKVAIMVEAGADVNFLDKNNKSALNRVADRYDNKDKNGEKIITLLLEKGGKLGNEGNFGGTVGYDARSTKNKPVMEGIEKWLRETLAQALAAAHFANVTDADDSFWQAFAAKMDFGALLEWTKINDLAVVEGLLKGGLSPNPAQLAFETPLSVAANVANEEMVNILLKYGANPNISFRYGSCALSYACYQKDSALKEKQLAVVKALLDAGADPNFTGSNHETALCSAVCSDNKDLVELLYAAGAKVEPCPAGWMPMIRAAQTGQMGMIEWLLEKGANINLINTYRQNALHISIEKNNTNQATFLINHGIDVNLEDFEGNTPLIMATKKGDERLIDLLLAAKADPYYKNKNKQSALDLAEYRDNLKEVFKPYTKQRSDKDLKNDSLFQDCPLTDLLIAIYHRNTEMAMPLIQAKREIDSPNYRGDTPLMIAIFTGQIELAKALIDAGADILSKNEQGDDAFTMCLVVGDKKTEALLEKKGRKMILGLDDLNQQASVMMRVDAFRKAFREGDIAEVSRLLEAKEIDINAMTTHYAPIHYAFSLGDKAILQVLLRKGALATLPTSSGETPMMYAENNAEMKKILKKYVK